MTQKQDKKQDKWRQAADLSQTARSMVDGIQGLSRFGKVLAEGSLGMGYCGRRTGLEEILRDLRKGSPQEQARELLTVLHTQYGFNADMASKLLLAVLTSLESDRMRVEADMDKYRELANAMKTAIPRELDTAKADVLIKVMAMVAATPASYPRSPATPEIELNPEKTDVLRKMLTDLGVSEQDANNFLYDCVRSFRGDAKTRLSGLVEGTLRWVAKQTLAKEPIKLSPKLRVEGSGAYDPKTITVSRNDLIIDANVRLKPEKEEEIVTEMLLYMLNDSIHTRANADLQIMLDMGLTYANKFCFYTPGPEVTSAVAIQEELPIEKLMNNIVRMMEAKKAEITEKLPTLPEDHSMRIFLSSTLGYVDAILSEAKETLGKSKPDVSMGNHAQFEANLPEDGLIRLHSLDTSPELYPSSEQYVKLVARISEYITERRKWYCNKEQGSGSLAAGCIAQDVTGESSAANYAAEVEESRQQSDRIRYVVMPKRLDELQAAVDAKLNFASLNSMIEMVRRVKLMQ